MVRLNHHLRGFIEPVPTSDYIAKVGVYFHTIITKNRMFRFLFRSMRHLFRYLFSLLIFQLCLEHL